MGEAAETEGDVSDGPPLSGESVTAADLDQALVAFVECLRPGLDGSIRVNFDRYLDFSIDYTLPDGRNDPEAGSRLFDDCDQKSGFLEKDFAYRRANSLTVNQIREIASEFTVCVEDAGMDPSVFASADELDSADDLERWRNTFYREAPAAEQESLRNCAETVFYGPVLEF